MSHDDVDEDRRSRTRADRGARSEPDERDATIERLERVLEEERQGAAGLRETNEALRFQLEVLEKSYAKQLEDERIHAVCLERELSAQQAHLAALDAEFSETMQLLAETRAYLSRLAADQHRAGSAPVRRDGRFQAHLDGPVLDGTINALIADENWPQAPTTYDDDNSNAHVPEPVDAESAQDMIAPELVFPEDEESDEQR